MKGLLVRVGADQTKGGGCWNGPVDLKSGRFVYVPIPERKPIRPGLERPYSLVCPYVDEFGLRLPSELTGLNMHLDPDFEYLSYGDRGRKGQQIAGLQRDDFLVFYAGLRDVSTRRLVYAIIGICFVQVVERALARGASEPDFNAHTRRLLPKDADDVIVIAKRGVSGRLTRCIPVGEYRSNAYRLRKDILAAWGGISSRDGYIQRSAVFPVFLTPTQFLRWWRVQQTVLKRKNFLSSKMATGELPAELVHPTEDALTDD